MPMWEKGPRTVRQVNNEVACYMERGFSIDRFDGYQLVEKGHPDPYKKTFVIQCGLHDGESIDLFDLQKWFDENRDWINELKKECE